MDTTQILERLKHGNLAVGEEGHLLMELESVLRQESGLPIEVFLATRKDDNKLRLQTLDKVKDWQKRRAEVKNEPPAA